MFSTDNIWLPYIYLYGVGFIIFVIGLWIILHYRACNLSRQSDRFWFGILIFGFVWYAGIHLIWYLAAIYVLPPGQGATP